jgi:predicted GNAT family acetyltransferase
MKPFELIHNEDESQFESHIDDQIAFVEYYFEEKKIYLTHTEVPKELQGQGFATQLIEQTLEYIKKNHLVLIPLCSFVANYVNKNPQWHPILSEGYQM